VVAYARHGPKKDEHRHIQFREVMKMPSDGARVALDWEVPLPLYQSSLNLRKTSQEIENGILRGPIERPVIILLHGINNDASFGYMKSLMRSCTNRGWNACGANFRGCGGIPLATPRGYNAAYTNDLRSIVHAIAARIKGEENPIFIVGSSLGANVVVKYLGEEGFSGTLPVNVAGGITLGNPIHINGNGIASPWSELIAAGIKKTFIQSWKTLGSIKCSNYKHTFRKMLMARNVAQIDNILAPIFIRNDPNYPFKTKIGYENGEAYWKDASSYHHVANVTVPLLQLSSQDDFLVANLVKRSFSKCFANPNVLVVESKCGGHLGWQETPQDRRFGTGQSWADNAVADFVEAVIEMRTSEKQQRSKLKNEVFKEDKGATVTARDLYIGKVLRSKL